MKTSTWKTVSSAKGLGGPAGESSTIQYIPALTETMTIVASGAVPPTCMPRFDTTWLPEKRTAVNSAKTKTTDDTDIGLQPWLTGPSLAPTQTHRFRSRPSGRRFVAALRSPQF